MATYQPRQYFIANAHNKLFAFYTGKGDLLKQILRPIGGGGVPIATPFESAIASTHTIEKS